MGGTRVLVRTLQDLNACVAALRRSMHLSVDVEACKGSSAGFGDMSVLQVQGVTREQLVRGTVPEVYIIDVMELGGGGGLLAEMLCGKALKTFYDCRLDYAALQDQLDITIPPETIVDLQLSVAAQRWKQWGSNHRVPLDAVLHDMGIATLQSDVKEQMSQGVDLWRTRPLTEHCIEYAASGVQHQHALWRHLLSAHAWGTSLTKMQLRELRHAINTEVPNSDTVKVPEDWLNRIVGPSGKCPLCLTPGHSPDKCTSRLECSICGAMGHSAEQCFKRPGATSVLKCAHCGGLGHDAAHCFKKKGMVCTHCGEKGHIAAYCRHLKPCGVCGELGHTHRSCPVKRASA